MSEMTHADRRHAMSEACLALRPALSFDQHLDRLLEIYDGIERNSSSNR